MKNALLALCIAAGLAPSAAIADCARDRMQACYAIESGRPASGRGGLSASEFCAADAVSRCPVEGAAAGVDRERRSKAAELDRAIEYLKGRKAADPALADADLKACWGSPGQDSSLALNCMMQRERDRASAGRFASPPAAVAPAASKPAPIDAKNLHEIVVEGGKLRIFEGDTDSRKSWIRYNDDLVEEFSGVYLSLRAAIFVGYSDTVLIYSTNPGGSGTVDSYGLVSVTGKGKVSRMDLPVGVGRFEYVVGNGRIAFELGLEDGKEVRAIYSEGRLDVTRTAPPKTGLKAEDCNFLYNDVLKQCTEATGSSCAYDDIGIAMAYQRPVNLMAHNDPNFREADFRSACEQSCKARKKPALATFRKAVCLPR